MTATTATASPSPTLDEHIATLRGLGWSDRDAEWLALVSLHSGAFTRGQYAARYRLSTSAASRFVRNLVARGVAREVPVPNRRTPEQICHVHARPLYRSLGIENNRHRRRSTPDVLLRRLLSLDYVLERPDLSWLPTEPQKVRYFQDLGVPLEALPHRIYSSPGGRRSTRRFFPVKLPIAGNGQLTTFVFADPGGYALEPPVRHWASTHEDLWSALHAAHHSVHVVAVTRTNDAGAANAAAIDRWRGNPTGGATLSPDEEALLAALRHARITLDFGPLSQWGGSVAAAKAEQAITERLAAAPAPAGHIDSYTVHVAERLTPDALAL